MLETFTKGCRKTFSAIAKVIGLSLVCAAIGGGLVLPLWKWASGSPFSYSIAVTLAFALVLLILMARNFKKIGAARFFSRFARVVTLLAGFSACVLLVLHGKRLLALALLVVSIALYSVITALSAEKTAPHLHGDKTRC